MRKERPVPDSPLNVMAVVCHPADAIDGAGGTLCLHAERGDNVTVVVCTHGVDTHDLERNDAIRYGAQRETRDHGAALGRKEREVTEGMRLLGVEDVRFLRFPDELLMVTRELIEALAAVMAEVQPHLLVLHNPTEDLGLADVGHADSAIAALKARYLANTPRFLEGKAAPGQRANLRWARRPRFGSGRTSS
jgi:LmbE family N-acetylglucosaminyl deacetylase